MLTNKNKIKMFKKTLCLFIAFLLTINSFAAIVSDNDGSAFVTKSEFEALKEDFADQVDNYNISIDSKIDGAIASYLAGITLAKKSNVPIASSGWENVCWQDGLFGNVAWKKVTPGTRNVGSSSYNPVPTRLRWNDTRLTRNDVPWSITRTIWEYWNGATFVILGEIQNNPKLNKCDYTNGGRGTKNKLTVPWLNMEKNSDGLFRFWDSSKIFVDEVVTDNMYYDQAGWLANSSYTGSFWSSQKGKVTDIKDVVVYNTDSSRVYDIGFKFSYITEENPSTTTGYGENVTARIWAYPKNMLSTFQQWIGGSGSNNYDYGCLPDIARDTSAINSYYSTSGIGNDAMQFAWLTASDRNRQTAVWQYLALGADDDNYPETAGVQPTVINISKLREEADNIGSLNDWSECDTISTTVTLTGIQGFNLATNPFFDNTYWNSVTTARTNRSFMRKLSGINLTFNIPTYKRVTLDKLTNGMKNSSGTLNMKQGMELWHDLEKQGEVYITINYEKRNSASGTVTNPNLVKFSIKNTDFTDGSDDYYQGDIEGDTSVKTLKNIEYNNSAHQIKIKIYAQKGSNAWLRMSPVNDIDNSDTSKRNLDYIKITSITQELETD